MKTGFYSETWLRYPKIRGLTKHNGTKLVIFVSRSNKKMKFKDFRYFFSTARINRYLLATGNSSKRAVKLYKANLRITQSFHPLLGVFEVVLRNRINDILTAHFTDPDWIIHQKGGFMSDPSLSYTHKKTGQRITNEFLKREILKVEKRLRKSGTAITSGKVIAEQTFGFWTDLFEVHHYKLLKGKPIKIFGSLPSGFGRKEVNDELEKVRCFRNRINHNEPVCFVNNKIDFSQTIDAYNSIINLLKWIDPVLINFINDLDRVNKVIERTKKI